MPTKICVDKSPIHGWGVFALEKISKGELIEQTPYVKLFERGTENKPCEKEVLVDYRFSFPANLEWKFQVMPFGCGGIYNHSDTPNAGWETCEESNTFKFYATRDIEAGEEIFTYYGPAYYWNRRSISEVK